jgi:hypothetical protein
MECHSPPVVRREERFKIRLFLNDRITTMNKNRDFWLHTAIRLFIVLPLVLSVPAGPADTAHAARIKDIATFGGVRDNQLIGYGLVVGLQGTGDKKDSAFTMRSMVTM